MFYFLSNYLRVEEWLTFFAEPTLWCTNVMKRFVFGKSCNKNPVDVLIQNFSDLEKNFDSIASAT